MNTSADPPGTSKQEGERRAARGEGPPFWEWVAAALGSLLLLATLGYLAYDAIGARPGSPAPTIQVTAVEKQESSFLVHLRVRNGGKSTAAGLKVVGVLRSDGRDIERSETEFQFVPGQSWRDGGLFFTRDPSGFELDLRAEGFQEP